MVSGEGVPRGESLLSTHTIFDQPWWLQAVAPGAWDEIVLEKGGRPAARLPYVTTNRRGLRIVSQPPLTQTLGPWLAPSAGKYAQRLAAEKDFMSALIERLPPFDLFCRTSLPP